MGAREFGLRVDHEMRERQIGASKLAARVGELPDGRVLDATGVRLIRQGRREKYDTELVVRIARAVGIDEDLACHIAGVEQPDFDLDTYRRLKLLAAMPTNELTARSVGQTVLPVPAELQDAALLRRLGVANLERRRAERRRRLRLVPQVERRAA
jgi:hypothetical protein